jgi:O-antigen ligase
MELPKRQEASRALMFLAICLFFAYLFPHHVHPFRSFYNDWLGMFGVVIALAYYIQSAKFSIQLPWITTLPAVWIIAISLQTAMGMLSESWDAALPVSYLIVAMLCIILAATITSAEGGSIKLCNALAIAHLLAGLISVAIASLQLSGAEIPFVPFMMLMEHANERLIRPYANIAQSNQLALLFCLSIASTWWLFQTGRLRASIAVGTVLALLWGLALTQSRIGWIIIPLFALTTQLWRRRQDFRSLSPWGLTGFIIIYAVMVIALPQVSSILGGRVETAAQRLTSASSGVRIVFIQQALQMSFAHPWFGVGWSQFGPQQLTIASDFSSTEYAQHAHNIVLNLAAELGWPVTIISFTVLSYWFFKSLFYRGLSRQTGFAALFFIAVLVHSMLEFPLWYAYVLVPFALLIGMVHQERFREREVQVSRRYLIAVLILLTSGLVGVAMDYRRVVAGFWTMELQSIGLPIDKTAIEKPSFTIFPYVYNYFQFLNTEVREGMTSEEIAAMERTAKRFGGALILTRMSQVYGLNGRGEDAVKAMLTIQRLHSSRHYKRAYEEWRHAPAQYEAIFRRLPPPAP